MPPAPVPCPCRVAGRSVGVLGRFTARASVLLLLTVAFLAPGTPSASYGAEPTATLTGVVRDPAGMPVEGARVSYHHPTIDVPPSGPGPSDTGWRWSASTDDDGRYEIRDVPLVAASPFPAGATLVARRHGYTTHDRGAREPDRPLVPTAPGTYREDFVLHRIDAVIRGRVTVRGDASPEGVRPFVEQVGAPGTTFGQEPVTHPDGRFEIPVPAGRFRVGAESRYGIAGYAPDLPIVRPGPAVDVAAGGSADVDVSLRPRLPYYATDQYGMPHFGYDETQSAPSPNARYPRDETPSVLSTVGPVLEHGIPRMAIHNEPGEGSSDLTAGFFGLNVMRIRLTNPGDHDLWVRDVRFEGPDAAYFSCEAPYFGPVDVPWVGCEQGFVLPGESKDLPLQVRNGVLKDEFLATVVVTTSAPGGTIRLPLGVRGPAAGGGGPAVAPGPDARQAAPASNPVRRTARLRTMSRAARTRVARSTVLTPRRVGVLLPRAGRAAFLVERRRAARGRGWTTVRRATVRRSRAGTAAARIPRLPAGRYRVRATVTLAGHAAASVTAERTVRSR